jgi:hypothetical protein
MIVKSSNIIIDNIKFKKRISLLADLFYIPIKYGPDNVDLFIQTPVLMIPFGIDRYNKLDVSFLNIIDNIDIKYLYEFVEKMERHVSKKYPTMDFISSIKRDKFYPDRLRLNMHEHQSIKIKIYNEQCKLIKLDAIKPRTYSKFIITPRSLWLKNRRIGINWNICQIKQYLMKEYLPQDYSFLEDDELDKPHNIMGLPSLYANMLKNGVPKEAIRMKMVMENVDPSLLEQPSNINLNMHSFGMLPPPLPSLLAMPSVEPITRGNFLNEISGGFKLNKMTIDEMDDKDIKYKSHDNYVPSLDSITQALSNLKSYSAGI